MPLINKRPFLQVLFFFNKVRKQTAILLVLHYVHINNRFCRKKNPASSHFLFHSKGLEFIRVLQEVKCFCLEGLLGGMLDEAWRYISK